MRILRFINDDIIRWNCALCAVWAGLALPTLSSAATNEPTNAAELVSKSSSAGYDLTADATRKAAMTPGEAAWEKVLEESLGDFYLPRYKKMKLAGEETAWDYVPDDPALPRVLLIGDSISRGYTLAVRHQLAGKVNVHRAPDNCGPTQKGLERLDLWLGDGKWDLIHLNFGIHDRATAPKTYSENLEKIIKRLEDTGARLVWASTTPPLDSENKYDYSVEQCDRLNEISDLIMQRYSIPVNDLHGLVQSRLEEWMGPDKIHFLDAGYEALGAQVADEILEYLPSAALSEEVK